MMVIQKVLLFGFMICSAWRFLESHKVRSIIQALNFFLLITFLQSLNYVLFRKITTAYNSKYISLYEAGISEDHSTINFTLNFARNITADLWLRATIAQRASKTEDSYRDIFTYNVNLCQVMGRGKGNSLINFWLDNILRQSNLPRTCPLKEVLKHWQWEWLRMFLNSSPRVTTIWATFDRKKRPFHGLSAQEACG